MNLSKYIEAFFEQKVTYYCYSIFRSILAFSLLLTLLFNDVDTLFPEFVSDIEYYGEIETYGIKWGACFLNYIVLYKVLACLVLITVITGFFPRVTGLLHFIVAFTFLKLCPVIDGGDQLHANFTLLLMPITLFDGNKNHWIYKKDLQTAYFKANYLVFSFLIKLQICFVYLNASIAKLSVAEWVDGTVMYYWVTHETFGTSGVLGTFLSNLLQYKIVYFVTWGVIVLELLLALLLFVDKKRLLPRLIFPIALLFHFTIIFVHGIFSFALVMMAALTFYFNYKPKYLKYGSK